VLETLHSLPSEIVSKRGGPAKLALAKGARFLRDRYKENLRRAIALGPTTRSSGELEKHVIASRGKAPSGGNGERYLVRVKKRDYINADGVRTNPLMTANLLEWGSSHQPATPFVRPTVTQYGEQTIRIVSEDLVKRTDKAVQQMLDRGKNR
jgi:HK97 gp10 family phage protein